MMKAAVITPPTIGDGFLMLIAAYHLSQNGYDVTFFNENKNFLSLATLFPKYCFRETFEVSSEFDFVLLENFDSLYSRSIIEKRKNLSVLYPSYNLQKHLPLDLNDVVFNPNLTIVENIVVGLEKITKKTATKEIGLPPSEKTFEKRIVLHPLTSTRSKDWSPKKFLILEKKLKEEGLEPIFLVSPEQNWPKSIKLPLIEAIKFISESGGFIGNDSSLGHIASYFQLPLVTIAQKLTLWRPGWNEGALLLPPHWIPNLKFFRLREKRWSSFISVKKVLTSFNEEYII